MTLRGPRPERRRHPRAITSFSALLSAGTVVMQTRVINLSMGGALLALRRHATTRATATTASAAIPATRGPIAAG